MNVLEHWTEEQLTRVPEGPSADALRRRARVRRNRRVGGSLVAVALVLGILGIAAALRSPAPRHVEVLVPAPGPTTPHPTTSTPRSTTAQLPEATAAQFPPLAKIISSVIGTVSANADPKAVVHRPVSAEIVASTDSGLFPLWGGTKDDLPRYLVQVRGSFVCTSCSSPMGATSPRGQALQVVFDTAGRGIGFGLTLKPWQLSRLGTVYRLPLATR